MRADPDRGTIRGPGTEGLQVGHVIAITDDNADTIEAEVLDVADGTVKIRARWDRVLRSG